MASITTTIEPNRRLTIHKIEGEVTLDQLVAKVLDYNAGRITPMVVWDFREGHMPNGSNDELWAAAQGLGGEIRDLPGRRVTLVASEELDFALLRVVNVFLDSTTKLEQKVFYDFKEALAWLDS